MKTLLNTLTMSLVVVTLSTSNVFANEFLNKAIEFQNNAVETADLVVVKGKLIATLDRYFVMTYKGKVYVCHVRDGQKVWCHLNEK